MKKLIFTFLALVAFCISGSAAELYSTTITEKTWTEAGAKTLNGVEWTLATNTTFFNQYEAARGQQIGKSSEPATYVTLSTNEIEGTITKIIVNTAGASGTNCKVSVKVGDTNFKCGENEEATITKTAATYEFVGEDSGEIVISWEQTSTTAIYLKAISVYDAAGELTEAEIAWSASNYTAELGATYEFPTLTNPNNLSVTYSSSNQEVATISEAGVIEVLAAGTTTIKAEFTGNETYKAATTEFTLTITKPLPSNLVSDEIKASMLKATSTSYVDFSDVTVNSDAVYAGNSSDNGGLSLRSKNSDSGIVSTTSGGYIRMITVDWVTANDRTLDIYVSKDAYKNASDLYNTTKQGTKIGSITAGQSTEFQIDGDYEYVGVRSNNNALVMKSITFSWEPTTTAPAVAKPTFTPEGGEVAYGGTVEIACETEGAVIYYTIDDTEPTKESDVYENAIQLWGTTTIKAIAYVGDDASKVATATFTVIPSIPSLISFEDDMDGEEFRFTTDLTVVYVNGNYNYVVDVDKNYGLIYKKDLNLNAGDVIKGGWLGKVKVYNGLVELVPQDELTVEGTAAFPTPTIINAANANEISAANQNTYVKIFGLVISAPETRAEATIATLGDTQVALYPQFAGVEIPTTAGTYNVTGFISVFNTVQVLPTAFEAVETVAAPTFSQAGGKYEDTIEITLACATEEADIYYSVDGSEPTTLYTPGEKIAINQADMVVKAVAQLGNVKSEVVSESYTILSLGVDFVAADNDAEYYTVSGVKVNNAAVAPGLYIRVNNGKAQKVIIRK